LKSLLDTTIRDDIRRLPLWQQLIIDTKTIATTAIDDIQVQNRHSPFLPASRCMLHHATSTVHGRYNLAYREAATLPALHSYMQRKHAWTNATNTIVHWTWFKRAIRYPREASAVSLTKLIYITAFYQERLQGPRRTLVISVSKTNQARTDSLMNLQSLGEGR
jgi:hypothetical protein